MGEEAAKDTRGGLLAGIREMAELSCGAGATVAYSADGFFVVDIPRAYHIIFYSFIFSGAFWSLEEGFTFLVIHDRDLCFLQRERRRQELCGRRVAL